MTTPEELKYSIACPACPSRFKVAASKIGARGSRFRCPRCGAGFVAVVENGEAVCRPVDTEPPPGADKAAPVKSSQASAAPPAAEPVPSDSAPPILAQAMPELFSTNVEKPDGTPPAPSARTDAPAPASPVSPAAAAAAPPEVEWRLDVPEYAEYTFTLAELRKLVRDGGLFPKDRVQKVGEATWAEAGQVPEFKRLFDLKGAIESKKAAAGTKAAISTMEAPKSRQHACANHPQWEAGYRCTKCNRYLCVHCVDSKQSFSSVIYLCKTCRDVCTKVDKSYAIVPFYNMLPELFSAPLKSWGPVMLLINAALYWLSTLAAFRMFGGMMPWLFRACVMAYLLWIVKYAAKGRETVPDWPDTTDIFDLAKIGWRAGAVTFISALPVLVFVLLWIYTPAGSWMRPSMSDMGAGFQQPGEPDVGTIMQHATPAVPPPQGGEETGGGGSGGVPDTTFVEQYAAHQGAGTEGDMSADARQKYEERMAREQAARAAAARGRAAEAASGALEYGLFFLAIVIVLSVIGFIYYPMGLAVVAVWNVLRPVWNPFTIFRFIRRILGEYVVFLVFFAVTGAIGWVGQLIAAALPIVGGIGQSIVMMYFSFVTSFMLGRLCYSNDARIGWEEEIYPGTAHT